MSVDASCAFDVAGHLAALDAQGYTVIPDFLSAERIADVRAGLVPYLDTHGGRNRFEGFLTERVYTLVARGKVFEDIVEDARVLALLDRLMRPNYLLSASQAICIRPGEKAQAVHHDDGFYPVPRPRPSIGISTIVAVDAFTVNNGSTEVISGSHRWSDADIAGAYGAGSVYDADAPTPPVLAQQLRPMVLPAGACIVFQGTLLHRGGANRSSAPRLALTNQYCEPWARTQENFFLGIPPELAREMSPRMQAMLGYSVMPPFMGQVTASHPAKTLKPGYVNTVLAQRHGSGVAAT